MLSYCCRNRCRCCLVLLLFLLLSCHSWNNALRRKGCPCEGVFAFIDGTVRRMRSSGVGHESVYSGHKRFHGLKYQSLLAPDGMFLDMYGPVEGRIHDVTMLAESKLEQRLWRPLRDAWLALGGAPRFCIFGDGAYKRSEIMMSSYLRVGRRNTTLQKQMNEWMSQTRARVEWGFAIVLKKFPLLHRLKSRRAGARQTPVALWWQACVLLSNFHNCYSPNQVSQHFECRPPTIRNYLGVQ